MTLYEYRSEFYESEYEVSEAIIKFLAPNMGDVDIEETKAFEDEWNFKVEEILVEK
jgi:hypothetical protein